MRQFIAISLFILAILNSADAQNPFDLTNASFADTLCENDSIIQTLYIDTSGTSADSVQWFKNGLPIESENSDTFHVPALLSIGVLKFQATWFENNIEIDTSQIAQYEIRQRPDFTVTDSIDPAECAGTGSIELTGTPVDVEYVVSFSNGNEILDTTITAIDGTIVIDNLVAGSYTNIEIRYADLMGCLDDVPGSVTLADPPKPNASIDVEDMSGKPDDNTVCEGDTIMLIGMAEGNDPFIYDWSGAADTDTLIVYAKGTYTLTVTDDNGCTNTAEEIIDAAEIPEPPVPDSNNVIYYCEGAPASPLQVEIVSGFDVTWFLGDMITTDLTPSTDVPETLMYHVVQASESTGCASLPLNIDVEIYPKPTFTIDIVDTSGQENKDFKVCENDAFSLTIVEEFEKYEWKYDNLTRNSKTITIPHPNPGPTSYFATVSKSYPDVVDRCVSNPKEIVVETFRAPTVKLNVPDTSVLVFESFFVVADVDLVESGEAIVRDMWSWDMEGLEFVDTTRLDTLEIMYNLGGRKNVQLKVQNAKYCWNSPAATKISVRGEDYPDVDIVSGERNVCEKSQYDYVVRAETSGNSFEFKDLPNTVIWDIGSGNTLVDSSPIELTNDNRTLEQRISIEINDRSNFSIEATVTETKTNGSGEKQVGFNDPPYMVTVEPDPALRISSSSKQVCTDESVMITFESWIQNLKFEYSIGGGLPKQGELDSTGILQVDVQVPEGELEIKVTNYIGISCDFDVMPYTVTGRPLPVLSLNTTDTSACVNDEVKLFVAQSNTDNLKWFKTGGELRNGQTQDTVYFSAEDPFNFYSVYIEAKLNECLDTIWTSVTIDSLPEPEIYMFDPSGDAMSIIPICKNQSDVVYATGLDGAHDWTITGGLQHYIKGDSISINWVDTAEDYSLSVTVTLGTQCEGSTEEVISFSAGTAIDTGIIYYVEETELLFYTGDTSASCYRWGVHTMAGDDELLKEPDIRVFKHPDGKAPNDQAFIFIEYWVETTTSLDCDFGEAECVTRTWFKRTLPPVHRPIKEEPTIKGDMIVYPNPNSGQFYIDFGHVDGGEYSIVVVDVLGRVLMKDIVEIKLGNAVREYNMLDVVNGMVYVQITDAEGNSNAFPMVVNR
jgi:hypothetical protein